METAEIMKQKEFNPQRIPYSERFLVVIVPDIVKDIETDVTRDILKIEKNIAAKKFWSLVNKKTLKAIANKIILDLTIETVINGIKKLRQQGFSVLLVGSSEAQTIKFPPGHPQKKTIYAGHPAVPNIYNPIADFHRMTFESKSSEAINLLMSLGAKTLKVYSENKKEKSWLSNVNIDIPIEYEGNQGNKVRTNINSKTFIKSEKDSDNSIKFWGSLSSNGHPCIPENLVWYPYESTWQTIANGCLNHGLENFNLVVNYNNDYGITVSLKTLAEKSSFNLGGKFNKFESTKWIITGTFN